MQRLIRMGLALVLAAGVYLAFLDPSETLEFTGSVPDVVLPEAEPDAGPGLALTGEAKAPEPIAVDRGQSVHGTVRTEAGKPAVGVRVELVFESPYVDVADPTSAQDWSRGAARRRAEAVRVPKPAVVESFVETDEKGAFELTTRDWGRYRLRAVPEAPRFGTHAVITVGERPPKPIELRTGPGVVLTGRVIDMAEQPVAAFVRLTSTKLAHGIWQSDPLANDPKDGAFRVAAMPPGTYAVTVIVPGRFRMTGTSVTLPREEPLVLRVPLGGAGLAGKITGPEKEPVPGADVLVTVKVPASGAVIEAVGQSREDGGYTVEHLPVGPVSKLTVTARGYLDHQGTLPLAPWAGATIPEKGSTSIEVQLLKGAAVFGVVRLADGTPLVGVSVIVIPSRWRPPTVAPAGPLSAISNEEGRFRIAGVPMGKHVLFAVHEGHYLPALEDTANQAGPPPNLLVLVDAEAKDLEREIVMAAGIAIRGVVLDTEDTPVADAAIRSKSPLQSRWWHTWGVWAHVPSLGSLGRSAEDGSFTITSLPPRPDWVLAASVDGRLGQWSDMLSNEKPGEPVTLRVEDGIAIRGSVIDDDGPVAGANVRIWTRNRKVVTGNLSSKSADDGTFEILGVPTGNANLNAYDDNGRRGYLQVKDLVAGEDREDLEVKLKGSGVEVAGILRDEDENPLRGYRIQAYGRGPDPHTVTDSEGRFAFDRGPSGKIRFRVQQPGGHYVWLKERFQSPADDLELTFVPKPQRVITGTILGPDRKPVPLVQVQAGVGKAPKDNAWRGNNLIGTEAIGGTFRLSVLGEGKIWIRAQTPRDAEGQPLNARATTKVVEEGEEKKPIEIVLGEALTVRGVVKGPDDELVRGALVSSGRLMARTGEDGTFELRGVKEGKLSLGVRPPPDYSAPAVTKTEGGAEGVEITLLRAAVLRGQVVDASGAGLTYGRAYARWQDPNTKGRQSRSAQLDSEGRFVIKGIPAGMQVDVDARLWGRQNRGRVAEVKKGVDPSAGEVVLVAERGATISGYVVDDTGQAVVRARIRATRVDKGGSRRSGSARTNNNGDFSMSGLNEGEYKLTVTPSNSMLVIPPVFVQAPAEGVRIRLPAATTISGRLDDPAGTSGWSVMLVRANSNRSVHVGLKSDGTFVAKQVAPDELWTIRAYNTNANLYALEHDVPSGADDIVLRPLDGHTISGRVEMADGSAVRGYIHATATGWSISRTTDVQGNFTMGPFPPGSFNMWVYQQNKWNNRVQLRDIASGTSSLIVQLPK